MEHSFLINLSLKQWDRQNKLLLKVLGGLSDEQLSQQVAPGKNSGRYLIGHLTAVHDYLFPILDLGKQMYPEIEPLYIRTPDNPTAEQPSVAELREMYTAVMEKLADSFGKVSESDWLSRHMYVSAEDFAKEPHRNKLNVLMSRTNHLAYHIGQLILLT